MTLVIAEALNPNKPKRPMRPIFPVEFQLKGDIGKIIGPVDPCTNVPENCPQHRHPHASRIKRSDVVCHGRQNPVLVQLLYVCRALSRDGKDILTNVSR